MGEVSIIKDNVNFNGLASLEANNTRQATAAMAKVFMNSYLLTDIFIDWAYHAYSDNFKKQFRVYSLFCSSQFVLKRFFGVYNYPGLGMSERLWLCTIMINVGFLCRPKFRLALANFSQNHLFVEPSSYC